MVDNVLMTLYRYRSKCLWFLTVTRKVQNFLLRIILKQNGIKVINVAGQREFQNPVVGGRNIRLDIFAKDVAGKYYNVEAQKKPEGAHIRRARFNTKDMYYSELAKGVKHFKEEEGRKLMCEAVEKYGDESDADIGSG